MLKKISLILLMLTVTVCFAACDGEDGNTSGSAESNGVISDESSNHTSGTVSDESSNHTSGTVSNVPNTSHEESDDGSHGIGDEISDMISDAEGVVSDVISGAEDVASGVIDGQ